MCTYCTMTPVHTRMDLSIFFFESNYEEIRGTNQPDHRKYMMTLKKRETTADKSFKVVVASHSDSQR